MTAPLHEWINQCSRYSPRETQAREEKKAHGCDDAYKEGSDTTSVPKKYERATSS
jgi:hypothetical protein